MGPDPSGIDELSDEIMEYLTSSEEWVTVGNMREGRYAHAVTVIPLSLAEELCSD